jgi:hypothetical protein
MALIGAPARAQQPLAPTIKASPVAMPQRVLFLGNTLIYYSGDLQSYTHRIAAADTRPLMLEKGFRSVHITDVGLDFYPIEYLVKPGNLGIKENFDIVLLAGSSRDALTEAGRDQYRQIVRRFDAAIRAQGGRTALLWLPEPVKPHPLAGNDLFGRNRDMVVPAANDIGAIVIPVGLAYHEAYCQRPDLKLQADDGNQPSAAGEYLAACVVYASLYERSPVGNPYDAGGAVDRDTRAFLQAVAQETVQEFYGRNAAPR